MITFFPAQYSAISMFATSGNPCITVADGIFAGAAKASAPLIACIPTRAAREIFFMNCMMTDCECKISLMEARLLLPSLSRWR